MKPNTTNTKHTVLLVDASGSMMSHTDETIESIKSILTKLDKDIHFTLIYFDTNEYKIVANDWTKNISVNKAYLYEARGGTPITDSVYKAIQDITNGITDITLMSEPHKIICFTDGQENSSKHVTSEELGRAVEHFTENFGWNFQFIGPKSQEESIKNYTNQIKIKPENLTLYASVSQGLKEMEAITTS